MTQSREGIAPTVRPEETVESGAVDGGGVTVGVASNGETPATGQVTDDKQEIHPEVHAMSRVRGGLAFGLALGAAAIGSFILFRLLNRMKIEGTENIPEGSENVLYCLNHNSILDNFAFESAAYLPKVLFQPEFLPIQLADRKNFFGDPKSRKFKDKVLGVIAKYFLRHLRTFPVDRKSGDLAQVDQWIELLKQNIVVVFPEGTRSRSGEIGAGKAGVGKLIYRARPTVIPVRMVGMSRVLGVGRIIPGAFQTVRVFIDRPLDMSGFFERPLPTDHEHEITLYRDISNHVIDAIRAIKPDIPEPS